MKQSKTSLGKLISETRKEFVESYHAGTYLIHHEDRGFDAYNLQICQGFANDSGIRVVAKIPQTGKAVDHAKTTLDAYDYCARDIDLLMEYEHYERIFDIY